MGHWVLPVLTDKPCISPAVPPNGLVVYCGTIVTDEGKEKKVNIDFEPFKPINTSLYLCDNKFHTEVRLFNTPLSIIFPPHYIFLIGPFDWEIRSFALHN